MVEMFLWVSRSGCSKNLEDEEAELVVTAEVAVLMFYLNGFVWVEGWCFEIELYF